MSIVIAGLEPCFKTLRVAGRSFLELDDSSAFRLQAVVRDGQDRGQQLRTVAIPDLNNVSIRVIVQ